MTDETRRCEYCGVVIGPCFELCEDCEGHIEDEDFEDEDEIMSWWQTQLQRLLEIKEPKP